jgi:predicted dehydrogenase
LKILIIGLGGIGQRHTRNLRALLGDSVEIIAYRVRRLTHVVTPAMGADQDRNVEDVYNIHSFDSLEEALAQRPDAAFVCNPSSLHVAVTRACLEAGVDVFVEKPLADSLEGTGELAALAQEKKRVAMVGYQLRFHPCVKKLQEVVASGELGSLLGVRSTLGEYLPNWHPYEDYRTMYAAREDLGGGVVLTQIHELDFLYSMFGLPSRVYAVGGHWSDLEIDVEDTASSLMEIALDGRILPIQLHTDYLQSPPNRQTEVIGDRGRVVMDLHAQTVATYARGLAAPEIFHVKDFDRNNLFLDQTRHFLECIRTRAKPVVDLHDGIQSMRMAVAIKQSIAEHRPVDLDQAPV